MRNLTVVSLVAVVALSAGCNSTEAPDEETAKSEDALRMCDPDCYSGDRIETEKTTNVSTVYQQYNSCPPNGATGARAAHNSATMALRAIYGMDQHNGFGDDVCYSSATVDNFAKLRTFRDLIKSGKCTLGAPVRDWKCGEYYSRRAFTCSGITSSQASTLYGLATSLENSCSTLDSTKSSTRPGISAFFYPKGVEKTTTKTYQGGVLKSTTYKVVGELDPEENRLDWGIYNDGEWSDARDGNGNWTAYAVKWPPWAQWGLDPFFVGWNCSPWGSNAGEVVSQVIRDYGGGYYSCE